jgi:hypothetical protein
MAIRIFIFIFLKSGEFGSFFPWKILCIGQNHIFQVKICQNLAPEKKTLVIQNCITSLPSLMSHMPIVMNALSTRVMLQFFPPVCPLPHFLVTLVFLGLFWVHVIHVLGMFQALGGNISCYKTLGKGYQACYLALGTHNMGSDGRKT